MPWIYSLVQCLRRPLPCVAFVSRILNGGAVLRGTGIPEIIIRETVLRETVIQQIVIRETGIRETGIRETAIQYNGI